MLPIAVADMCWFLWLQSRESGVSTRENHPYKKIFVNLGFVGSLIAAESDDDPFSGAKKTSQLINAISLVAIWAQTFATAVTGDLGMLSVRIRCQSRSQMCWHGTLPWIETYHIVIHDEYFPQI